MTQNFVPQFVPQVAQQPVQAMPVAQPMQMAPVAVQQVPQSAVPVYGQQKPKGPNIWYRPVSQQDYKKIAEMNTATIIVRILPGFNQTGIYESIFEKNTANSKFPNSKRWLCPVLVLNDSLHPERNGFVGVMEISKTLYNRIKNKNTPANYFDFNAGHNFHINVSLQQSKDGQQWFPNYGKSGFEAQPSPCQAQYACQKMNEGKFSDFATFMNRVNNPKPQGQVAYNPQMPAQVQVPTTNYAPQQQYNSQPVAQQQPQFVPQAAPQPQFIPQQAPQQQPVVQGPAGSEAEFDEIFGQQ